jgi:hypothetical protein
MTPILYLFFFANSMHRWSIWPSLKSTSLIVSVINPPSSLLGKLDSFYFMKSGKTRSKSLPSLKILLWRGEGNCYSEQVVLPLLETFILTSISALIKIHKKQLLSRVAPMIASEHIILQTSAVRGLTPMLKSYSKASWRILEVPSSSPVPSLILWWTSRLLPRQKPQLGLR